MANEIQFIDREALCIVGNKVVFQNHKEELEGFINFLIQQQINLAILEYPDQCDFIKLEHFDSSRWQNDKQNGNLKQLRLFGKKGDLLLSIDGNEAIWRYIGDYLDNYIDKGDNYWDIFEIEYPDEKERGLRIIERQLILWGNKTNKTDYLLESRFGKRKFCYPINQTLKPGNKVAILATEYTLYGHTQFVRYRGLEVV